MALSELDRDLLTLCLDSDNQAWASFVDRFLPLVTQVVNYSASCRSVKLSASDREDLIAEVFVVLLDDDMAALRHFQKRSSLATYLSVIARRVTMHRLMNPTNRRLSNTLQLQQPGDSNSTHGQNGTANGVAEPADKQPSAEQLISDREQVDKLLKGVKTPESDVIRMFHLEGMSYAEISRRIDVPENTIGPLLSRARAMLRRRKAGI